jgi:hypothetical protein
MENKSPFVNTEQVAGFVLCPLSHAISFHLDKANPLKATVFSYFGDDGLKHREITLIEPVT